MGLEEYAELSERKAGSSRGTADPDHADAGPPLSAEERKAGLKRAVAPMPRPVEGTRRVTLGSFFSFDKKVY